MLFEIDISLISELNNPSPSLDLIETLDLLARACWQGNHLIFADRNVLEFLKDFDGASPITKHVFEQLFQIFPQSQAYLSLFSYKVIVVGVRDVFEHEKINNVNVIRISANVLSQTNILNPTILLGENLNDANFLIYFGRARLIKNRLQGVHLSYDPRGGGGHTTADIYDDIQQARLNLCLCIVDSDKLFPSASIGQTARDVQRVNDVSQPLCQYFILPTHEIENIIPLSILTESSENDPNLLNAINDIRRVESEDSRLFLDIKQGLKLNDIINNTNIDFANYWNSVIAAMSLPNDCWAASECVRDNDCTCIVFHSMGNNVISNVLSYVQNITHHKLSEMVDKSVEKLWEIHGDIIISWCCANYPMRTLGSD